MIKTRQDYKLTDLGAFYNKNDTELSWSIRSGANSDGDQIGQLHDWLYTCNLCRKQNWVVVIDQTCYSLW